MDPSPDPKATPLATSASGSPKRPTSPPGDPPDLVSPILPPAFRPIKPLKRSAFKPKSDVSKLGLSESATTVFQFGSSKSSTSKDTADDAKSSRLGPSNPAIARSSSRTPSARDRSAGSTEPPGSDQPTVKTSYSLVNPDSGTTVDIFQPLRAASQSKPPTGRAGTENIRQSSSTPFSSSDIQVWTRAQGVVGSVSAGSPPYYPSACMSASTTALSYTGRPEEEMPPVRLRHLHSVLIPCEEEPGLGAPSASPYPVLLPPISQSPASQSSASLPPGVPISLPPGFSISLPPGRPLSAPPPPPPPPPPPVPSRPRSSENRGSSSQLGLDPNRLQLTKDELESLQKAGQSFTQPVPEKGYSGTSSPESDSGKGKSIGGPIMNWGDDWNGSISESDDSDWEPLLYKIDRKEGESSKQPASEEGPNKPPKFPRGFGMEKAIDGFVRRSRYSEPPPVQDFQEVEQTMDQLVPDINIDALEMPSYPGISRIDESMERLNQTMASMKLFLAKNSASQPPISSATSKKGGASSKPVSQGRSQPVLQQPQSQPVSQQGQSQSSSSSSHGTVPSHSQYQLPPPRDFEKLREYHRQLYNSMPEIQDLLVHTLTLMDSLVLQIPPLPRDGQLRLNDIIQLHTTFKKIKQKLPMVWKMLHLQMILNNRTLPLMEMIKSAMVREIEAQVAEARQAEVRQAEVRQAEARPAEATSTGSNAKDRLHPTDRDIVNKINSITKSDQPKFKTVPPWRK